MTVIVLVILGNFLFGVACLWIAYRVWQFRGTLSVITDRILGVEQAVHRVLYPAPNAIRKAQAGTRQLRDRYQKLGIQYERVQQMISILSLIQLIMQYGQLLQPRSSQSAKRR